MYVCGAVWPFAACLGKHRFILLQAKIGVGWVGGAEHSCICAYHSNYTASSLNKQAVHIINIPEIHSQEEKLTPANSQI